jgi:hypothetical protein
MFINILTMLRYVLTSILFNVVTLCLLIFLQLYYLMLLLYVY